MMKPKQDEPDLFDRPSTRKWLWRLLYAACIITVLLELFIHRHPHFVADRLFGFHALLGFLACSAMILAAKLLGLFLKVDEDFYDDDTH